MAVLDGDGALLFSRVWDGEPTRAPEWIAELAQGLAENGVGVEQFAGFVCGLGPGSFSGIRASLSAAQGMALPGNNPVYGVASAAALALGQAGGAECVTVIGDARRNRLWSVTYRVDPDARRVRLYDGRAPTHTSDDFQLTPAADLAAAVPAGTRIVSCDWERLSGLLGGAFEAERLVPRAVFPLAEDVGRLALAEPAARVFEPVPVYLHPAVAERVGV
jgi:tRNA threonylcarbamoyladenosine biosynthesis protein TsaB